MKNTIVISFLVVINIVLFNNVNASTKENISWDRFNKLSKEKKYNEAFNYLDKFKNAHDSNVFLNKGFLLFGGYVDREDKCDAVYEFEQARKLGAIYALTYLSYIYNGAYIAIAAEEGQPEALLELAKNYWASYKIGNAMTPFSKEQALKDVYRLFKRAELQRAIDARFYLGNVRAELKTIGAKLPVVSPDFKKVICDIRRKN